MPPDHPALFSPLAAPGGWWWQPFAEPGLPAALRCCQAGHSAWVLPFGGWEEIQRLLQPTPPWTTTVPLLRLGWAPAARICEWLLLIYTHTTCRVVPVELILLHADALDYNINKEQATLLCDPMLPTRWTLHGDAENLSCLCVSIHLNIEWRSAQIQLLLVHTVGESSFLPPTLLPMHRPCIILLPLRTRPFGARALPWRGESKRTVFQLGTSTSSPWRHLLPMK